MADFGIGEAAAAEGAKAAGEAAAAEGAGAAGAEALGAGALEGGAGALGAEALGEGALALGADAGLGELGLAGLEGFGAEALPAATEGLADFSVIDPSIETGLSAASGTPGVEGLPVGGVDPATAGFDISTTPEGVLNPTLKDVAAPSVADAGGGGSTLSKGLLDKLMDNKGTAAILGINAASALQSRKGTDASKLEGMAKPFQKTGEDLLKQYQSGKLNPGDEFNINQWEHQQIAAAKSQAAKGGQGNSSAARNAIAQIQAKAQAMREQARQGLLDAGLKALGMATGPLTSAIQASAQQDREFQASQSSALNSLMLLRAMEARGG